MIERIDTSLAGFDAAVLERWGLKPTARETLTRAKEKGAITPQEISEMISGALAKDRQKMAEVLQELKKTLQNLDITVTFNVVHTHTHIVQSPATAPAAPAPKPKPQQKAEEQTIPASAAAKTPQYAGKGHESPFLTADALREHGLKPEALAILQAAHAKGSISPQEIGALIPSSISQDREKLRPIMRWIIQLLNTINVKIVIGEVHYKSPESKSPEVSYSIRPGKTVKALQQDGLVSDKGLEEYLPTFIFDKDKVDQSTINSYYRVAARMPILKSEEVVRLSRKFRASKMGTRAGNREVVNNGKTVTVNDAWDYESRNKIVMHNLRFVLKLANKYLFRGLEYDDLVQEGNMGLMIAAEEFDPSKGYQFSTYAQWWIRSRIARAIQNFKSDIRIPVHVQELKNKILGATCELAMELQREPTIDEVAARLGKTFEEVDKVLHQLCIPIVSMEELLFHRADEDSKTTVGDVIVDNHFPSAVNAFEAKEDLERSVRNIRTLLAAIKALPINDRHKTVFKMFWGLEGHSEDHTHESIRPAMGGVTRSRIQQMEDRVWKELAKNGITITKEQLGEELKRVHYLENIVSAEADLSTPTEAMVLEEVSIVFQDEADKESGEVVPSVLITPGRPKANLQMAKQEAKRLQSPRETLSEIKPGSQTQDEIIRVVSGIYGKRSEDVLDNSRAKEIVWIRWVCIYIMRKELKSSFVSIGQALRYADHTTAIHGYQSFKRIIERDPGISEEIEKIASLCGFRQEKQVDPEQVALVAESALKAASPIVDQVLTLTSRAFDIEKSNLFAKSRSRPDDTEKYRIRAKSFAMHVLRTDFNVKCQEVTQIFGFVSYHRASVICSRIAKEMKFDADLQAKLELIRNQYSLDVYGEDLQQIKQCQKRLFPKQVVELKGIVEKIVKPFQEKVHRLQAKLYTLDMPDRHKEILRLRFEGDLTKEIPTYEALGQTYDITRERVRQIIAASTERLIPTLEPSDADLVAGYAQEFEKVRLLVELQKL